MKMKKITTITIELSEEEMKKLEWVMDYAHHRSSCHETPVTKYEKFIDEFRREVFGKKYI